MGEMKKTYTLHSLTKLNAGTVMRLHNLGLHDGSVIKVIRKYPFHGPVIIENNRQRIGIRFNVFKTITGES